MTKYEYKAVEIKISGWTGKSKSDYLQVLNDYGSKGWKFLQIIPSTYNPEGKANSVEFLLERQVQEA